MAKRRCRIVDTTSGYFFKQFENIPLVGKCPVWANRGDAMIFESMAQAREWLKDYRFDRVRKRCRIVPID